MMKLMKRLKPYWLSITAVLVLTFGQVIGQLYLPTAYVEHYRQRSRNRRYRLHLEHWDEDALNLVCFCYLVGYRGLSRIQNFHGIRERITR